MRTQCDNPPVCLFTCSPEHAMPCSAATYIHTTYIPHGIRVRAPVSPLHSAPLHSPMQQAAQLRPDPYIVSTCEAEGRKEGSTQASRKQGRTGRSKHIEERNHLFFFKKKPSSHLASSHLAIYAMHSQFIQCND